MCVVGWKAQPTVRFAGNRLLRNVTGMSLLVQRDLPSFANIAADSRSLPLSLIRRVRCLRNVSPSVCAAAARSNSSVCAAAALSKMPLDGAKTPFAEADGLSGLSEYVPKNEPRLHITATYVSGAANEVLEKLCSSDQLRYVKEREKRRPSHKWCGKDMSSNFATVSHGYWSDGRGVEARGGL